MPHYRVHLSAKVYVDVEVEAADKEEAKKNWASCRDGEALQEAISASMDEAEMLDDYEFDVVRVDDAEKDEED